MDARDWDERYAASDLVWSREPNQFVAAELADLPPGTAVDLGAGTFDLEAGEKGKAVVKLNKRARAKLGKKASVKAVLVVRFEDGSTQRVRVRLTR